MSQPPVRLLLEGEVGQVTVVPITSPDLDAAEYAWFAALCSDDYRYLGVPDGSLRSSWAHCSDIVREAESQGFGRNVCETFAQLSGTVALGGVAATTIVGIPVIPSIN